MESEGTHMARRTGLLPNRAPMGSFREGLKSCFYLRLRHKNGFVWYFLFAALRFTRAQYVVRSDASVLSRTSATQPLPCRAPPANYETDCVRPFRLESCNGTHWSIT